MIRDPRILRGGDGSGYAPPLTPPKQRLPATQAPGKRTIRRAVIASVDNPNQPKVCSVLIDNRMPPRSGFTFPSGTGAILVSGTSTYGGQAFTGPYFNDPSTNTGGSWCEVDTVSMTVVAILQGVSTFTPSSAAQLIATHVHTGGQDANGNPMPGPINTPQQSKNSTWVPNVTSVTITPTAGVSGQTSTCSAAFTISNQPTDGSLSRVSLWARVTGTTPWSWYGSMTAVGVGNSSPPTSGSYTFTFLDLTNGVGYDFGVSGEDAQGNDTSVSVIGSMSSQTNSITQIVDGSGNFLLTQWTNGKMQSDGSITNIDGQSAKTTFPYQVPLYFQCSGIIKRGATTSKAGFLIGSSTDGFEVRYDTTGAIQIYQWISGSATALGQAITMPNDTQPHAYTMYIGYPTGTVSSTNQIQVMFVFDGSNVIKGATPTASLPSSPLNITVYTGGNTGSLFGYIALTTASPSSSFLNTQGVVVGISDNTLSYTSSAGSTTNSGAFIITWSSFTLFFNDGSTVVVPASTSGTQISVSGLTINASTSTTYYVEIWYDLILKSVGYFTSGTTAGVLTSQMLANLDGRIPIKIDMAVVVPKVSGSPGGGGGGGHQSCPQVDQLMPVWKQGRPEPEVLPARCVEVGDRVADFEDGVWNIVRRAESVESECVQMKAGDEWIDVELVHLWLRAGEDPNEASDGWVRTIDLTLKDLLDSPNGTAVPVRGFHEPRMDWSRHILCDRHRFRIGNLIGHNTVTL